MLSRSDPLEPEISNGENEVGRYFPPRHVSYFGEFYAALVFAAFW